jgi:hypothetical protein
MYSNVVCALDCISKSSKERKTLDFHAESGNERVFRSGNYDILIVDMIAIPSAVFYELENIYLVFFAYPIHNRMNTMLSQISLILLYFNLQSIFFSFHW